MAHLLALAAAGGGLAATAWVLGRLLLDRLLAERAPGDRSSAEAENGRAALAVVVGLAALAQLAFLLGLAGGLRPLPLGGLALAVHLAGWRVWRGAAEAARRALRGETRGRLAARGLLALLVALPIGLLALYPPTAFDATLYHLPFARAFAVSGGLPFLPWLRFPVFPQLAEVLFAVQMLAAGDVAAHAVSFVATLATAGLLLAWGREAFSPAAGRVVAALYLGNPIVAYLAGVAYVEPLLVACVTGGLLAARRWRATASRRWLAVAAFLAASAADVKYPGLFWVAVVVALAVLAAGRGRRAAAFGLALAVAAAVLAPTYGRILAWTGNPVFPFFPRLFGASAWDPMVLLPPRLSGGVVGVARGLGVTLWELVRTPWDLVFARWRVGDQPPYSPLYLVGLPVAVIAAWRDRSVRRLLALAALFAAVVLALFPDARYLLPAAPLVSLAAAGALAPLLRPPAVGRRAAAALCLLALAPGWLYAARRVVLLGPPPLSAAGRRAYLERSLPGLAAIEALERGRGDGYTLYALHAENLRYFAAGGFLGEWSGPASYTRVLAAGADPEALYRALAGLGADHLLLVTGREAPVDPAAAGFSRRFRRVWGDAGASLFALLPPPPPVPPPPPPRSGRLW